MNGCNLLEEPDTTVLIRKIQQGDRSAFNDLMSRWEKQIHRFAYGFFADHDEASEITQKTFIRAYHSLGELKDPGRFSSWLYRIANNLCLDELRRAGRRKSSPLEAWVEQQNVSDEATPSEKLESRELGQWIHKALLTLPDEQRVVIILKEKEGLKFREIAEILEEPENTVKSRMYYGLKSLRRTLTKWNIPQEYLNDD